MSKSVGLDEIIHNLKNERERFLKAGKSGHFCDTEHCLKVAYTIELAIDKINKIREKLNC